MLLALQLAGGIVYLLMGGDLLVRGAVALSRRLRVSPPIVALTVVAFGTSMPELVVGLRAVQTGYPGIALGNVVGSNIANVFLVVGATAVVYPLAMAEHRGRRDTLIMLAATVLMMVLSWSGSLPRTAGMVLIACLMVLTIVAVRDALRTRTRAEVEIPLDWVLGVPSSVPMIGLFLIAGLVGLPLGARLVIEASVELAQSLGVSHTVIGLTLVALSTSLPELATTVIAAFQRRTELVLGTVIGSNLFNLLGIMGASALFSPAPIPVAGRALAVDLPVMLVAALVLTALVWRAKDLGRVTGALFLLAYGAYLVSFIPR